MVVNWQNSGSEGNANAEALITTDMPVQNFQLLFEFSYTLKCAIFLQCDATLVQLYLKVCIFL